MDGIICINKEKGYTSFSVIRELRKLLNIKKIGHGGTLDPLATGVLPIFIGKATKAADMIINKDKIYVVDLKLGVSTDTQDITGNIISSQYSYIDFDQFKNVVFSFVGEYSQIPPMYSALKVNGKKLYELARDGKEVLRAHRDVKIYKIDILEFDKSNQIAKLNVNCSKGTYMRTLCDDIGKSLGVGATLTGLIRTKTGDFSIDNSFTLEQIKNMCNNDTIKSNMIPIESVFSKYPKICLDEIDTKKFLNGVKLDISKIEYINGIDLYSIYDNLNSFIGLAKIDWDKNQLKINKIFF